MTADAKRALNIVPASTIRTRRQKWLWEGRIPLGTVTIFAGRGGEGKSTFALHIGAQAIRGELAGDLFKQRTNFAIISHEDDWATVMVPRLIAASADTNHVFKIGIDVTVDQETHESIPALPIDIDLLREGLIQSGARVLLIDPITSTIGGDLNKVADVRRALDPLASLAQELEIAVIALMHFSKGTGNLSDKLSGSHSFRDASRSVLMFATDEESGQRIVSVDKSNYSAERGSSFAFNLLSADIPTDDGNSTTVAYVDYLGDTDVSVTDIINRDRDGYDKSDDRNAAQTFLVDHLQSQDGGEAKAGDVIKAGRAAGFSEQEIKDARRRCKNPKVVSEKSTFGGGWAWRIEEGGTQGGAVQNAATFATFEDQLPPSPAPSTSEGGTSTAQGGEGGTLRDSATASPPSAPLALECSVCRKALDDDELARRGVCATWDTAHIQALRKKDAA